LAHWFWRRRFLKIFSVFLLFRYYLPLEKGYPLPLNIFESPSSKDNLCHVWLKLAQWFWRRFLNDPTPFLHFFDYLPFEEDLTLYLNKLEYPLPKDNFYQVWFNLACLFWRRRFFKIFSVFLLFRYYLPLERGYPLPLNKLESPSPKDDLYQVWLELAERFWRRRFLIDPTPFLYVCDYLPFKEDLALYLNKLEFPSPNDNLYQV
jgi:hypothetical protein